jgi:hypothetical protein
MRNTAGRGPAFADSALSVPRLRLGPMPSRRTLLSVWESDGGRLASPADAT